MSTTADPDVVIELFNPETSVESGLREDTVVFLHKHLEQYGDPAHHIRAALDYALSSEKGEGGYLVLAKVEGTLAGAVIVNRTGMSGYIPSNILVYIAVDGSRRGMGIGKLLMQKAIAEADGGVALHVEPDNPARRLYERLGFTNKYLEMRYEAP